MHKVVPIFAALLAGCYSAPSYRAPAVVVPERFVSGSNGSEASGGQPGSERSVVRLAGGGTESAAGAFAHGNLMHVIADSTLGYLIAEARRVNTDVRAAQARLMGARASRRLASLDLVPSITAVGSAVRQLQSTAISPGLARQLPQQEFWDAGFDASWEIDVFGRIGRNVRAQSAYVESAEYGMDDAQLSVTAEVARSYFELRGAQQQLLVSRRAADNQRRILRVTEERLAAGRGTAFDTERGKAALSLTLAAIPGLEALTVIHRQRIAVLLGRSSESLPAALLEEGALPELPDTLYVGTPQELIRRRPDVLAAERNLAAQAMFVGAARAEYLPRLTFGARAGYLATSFDSLTRRGTSRLLAGPVLSFPLFDLGRVHQRVEVAHARQSEALAYHDATVHRALSESDVALVTYDRTHARLAILADAVASSGRAAELARQRFEAGLTDFLQVLDAQRTLLESENQLVQGHTTAATALVAVYKAVGGTWPVR